MKVALFDFCETLVSFQTADEYVHYCRHKLNSRWMSGINFIHQALTKIYAIRTLSKIFPHASINKRLVLFQLYGIPYEVLDQLALTYYNERIKPHIIQPILAELIEKREQGYKIWILSGGYDIYIKYFVCEYNLEGFVSSQIGFSNRNICSGRMSGLDCLWGNKIYLFTKCIPENDVDLSQSYAYSDSKTDLPMLKWVDKGVVVSKETSQEWAKKNNLTEIIWKKKNN